MLDTPEMDEVNNLSDGIILLTSTNGDRYAHHVVLAEKYSSALAK